MTHFSDIQIDALKEVVNIGIGQSASSLNEMLDSHIILQIPSIIIYNPTNPNKSVKELIVNKLSCVKLDFFGSFSGTAALVFPPDSAANLVSALTGEGANTPGLNAVMAGTLNEVGNIVINGIIGSISNILSDPMDFSVPTYQEGLLADLIMAEKPLNVAILLINAKFQVEDLHSSS